MAEVAATDVVKCVVACDNSRDAEGYRVLLAPDYRSFVHGKPGTTGPDEEVASIQAWWRAMSDVHLEPLEMWESGGVVTLRYTLAGTNDGEFYGRPATGRKFQVENCTLLEVREAKVTRAWRYSDTLGLLGQLGLLPEG